MNSDFIQQNFTIIAQHSSQLEVEVWRSFDFNFMTYVVLVYPLDLKAVMEESFATSPGVHDELLYWLILVSKTP
jgi:hypothetical protein